MTVHFEERLSRFLSFGPSLLEELLKAEPLFPFLSLSSLSTVCLPLLFAGLLLPLPPFGGPLLLCLLDLPLPFPLLLLHCLRGQELDTRPTMVKRAVIKQVETSRGVVQRSGGYAEPFQRTTRD